MAASRNVVVSVSYAPPAVGDNVTSIKLQVDHFEGALQKYPSGLVVAPYVVGDSSISVTLPACVSDTADVYLSFINAGGESMIYGSLGEVLPTLPPAPATPTGVVIATSIV